jgi:hypothetical protein
MKRKFSRPPTHIAEVADPLESEVNEPPLGRSCRPFDPGNRFPDDPRAAEPEIGSVPMRPPTKLNIISASSLGGAYSREKLNGY